MPRYNARRNGNDEEDEDRRFCTIKVPLAKIIRDQNSADILRVAARSAGKIRMDGIHFVQILVRFLLLHKGAVPHMDDTVIATAFRACLTNRLQPRPGSRLPPWMVTPFVLFAQAAAAGDVIQHMARDYTTACETHVWQHVPVALERYLGMLLLEQCAPTYEEQGRVRRRDECLLGRAALNALTNDTAFAIPRRDLSPLARYHLRLSPVQMGAVGFIVARGNALVAHVRETLLGGRTVNNHDLHAHWSDFLPLLSHCLKFFEERDMKLYDLLPTTRLEQPFVPFTNSALVSLLQYKRVKGVKRPYGGSAIPIFADAWAALLNMDKVRKLARNPDGGDAKRQFYGFIRTDGHFVDVVYTRPPNGIPSVEDERKAARHVGRELTRPGAHAVGTPLEAAARSGELNGLAEAQLPEVGIDPGGGGGGKVFMTAVVALGEAVKHVPGLGRTYPRSDHERVVKWTRARWMHETRSELHTSEREDVMKLPAAAGMRAAHAAGSTKTASLERYLLYVRALYPHLAAVRAFIGRPNGLMRLRFRRFQDRQRDWDVFLRSIVGREHNIVIGCGAASIGNQLGGLPHGPVQEARRRLLGWVGGSHFFSVNEHLTSKTCSRCHRRVKQLYKPRLHRALYAVTRCRDNRCDRIWNRDTNAARNMRHILHAKIQDPAAPRPQAFQQQQHAAAVAGAAGGAGAAAPG